MRPTSIIGVIALIVMGVIVADFLTHPEGTTASANGIVAIEKPSLNALLGRPS